jgi:murein DD-endopeptidase MepM/ murein hydrolase activator NlpD
MTGSRDFFDDFNRADGSVDNGWLLAPDDVDGSIEIVDNALSTVGTGKEGGGIVGVYRPVDLTQSLTVSADLTPTSGFGGLQLRWTTAFLFGGDGNVNNGYGIYIYRGDENYNNSAILLYHNGQVVEQLASTFQFGSNLHLVMTLATDGSITGSVSSDTETFSFEFAGFTPIYSGTNLLIQHELASYVATQATVDDLLIDVGSDGAGPPLIFQQPFASEQTFYTENRDGDGWTMTNDFNEDMVSSLRGHRGHDHFHRGEDWVPDGGPVIGADVFAVADGQVVYAQYHPAFGNTVIIAHDVSGNGIDVDVVYSLYAHLNTIAAALGDVGRGDLIGEVGRTGTHAPHLHWEIFGGDWSAYLAGALVGYGESASPAGWFDPTDFVSAFDGEAPMPSAFPLWDRLAILGADLFLA